MSLGIKGHVIVISTGDLERPLTLGAGRTKQLKMTAVSRVPRGGGVDYLVELLRGYPGFADDILNPNHNALWADTVSSFVGHENPVVGLLDMLE